MAKSRKLLQAMAEVGTAAEKAARLTVRKAARTTARHAVECTALGVGVALVLAAGPVRAESIAPTRTFSGEDDFVSRLEALALLQTLNAELLSNPSATLTLERWCARHQLASPARVVARLVRGADKAATAAIRQTLGVGEAEPVRYRRVQLVCGDFVLSEADNWYVPARLTPEMNRLLDETDTAFGRAVQALQFRRRTLSARLLWTPLPDGWEMVRRPVQTPEIVAGALAIPTEVIRHEAVLSVPDGTPFSVVVETYTDKVLAFRRPSDR
ncbi:MULTISPECIES: hypothetical protein [unclassified Chelatococcus]|uniref:hypothetical protein n=1 Tax=unclassified Chelatococcus TaxID=2638111 RepID=UPI0020BF2AE1|nr:MULTISPECIES: hypothetical protein [unclassified Chelatococcus]MCO5078235.1 hypothetical protein [Chelatococcus sp.]